VSRTLKLTLEYDGAGFRGWARQPGLRTVQGVVEDAVRSLWPDAGPLAVAGRTDAGVHASGQVASLVVDAGPAVERVVPALNQALPADVAVSRCDEAPAGFHARFSAVGRVYDYRVLLARARSPLRAARTYHHPAAVDLAALDACAALLPGDHDFRAFTPAETQHEVFRRAVLEAAWRRERDELVLRVAADSFLRHMVRTLVGTMLEVARGGRDLESFRALLAGEERACAGPTAPAHALCLVDVRY
jgi:tRNA pseudouridine38-40 synthase